LTLANPPLGAYRANGILQTWESCMTCSLRNLAFMAILMVAVEGAASCLPNCLADRISIGIRSAHFDFTQNKKRMFTADGEFIGGFTEGISIDRLKELQNYEPLIFGRLRCTDYIAVELAQERMRGDARSYYGHTDGELDVKGVSLTLLGIFANTSRLQPYAGAGVAYLSAEFDHAPWGYGVHLIDTASHTTGYLVTVGCSATIWRGLAVDIAARYLEADVDSHFSYVPNASHYYWTFPIDNWAWQAGLKWTF
jgi:opacity protein-like surface antigen